MHTSCSIPEILWLSVGVLESSLNVQVTRLLVGVCIVRLFSGTAAFSFVVLAADLGTLGVVDDCECLRNSALGTFAPSTNLALDQSCVDAMVTAYGRIWSTIYIRQKRLQERGLGSDKISAFPD